VVAYAAGAWLGERSTLLGRAPLPKPPTVLVDRAREILERLGQDQMGGWAYSFEVDAMFLDHVRRDLPERSRWDNLAEARPGPFTFFYRQSPGRLVAANRDGVVTRDDPPSDAPGMAEVVLDPRGRLLSFVAVPPQMEAGGSWPEPDWRPLFREAELDPGACQPVAPSWAAPVDSDRKAAWTGPYSASSGSVRIEAAAYHGRPVWFAILPTWVQARSGGPREPVSPTPFSEAGLLVLAFALPAGGLLLARRNLRQGRGDRKGAFRLGVFVFVTYGVARLFRADHTANPADEVWLLIKLAAYPALWGGIAWLMYVALEPYARRRWPHILISWKRLLSGQWRDPLVGRDVLIGSLVGSIGIMVTRLPVVAAPALGVEAAPEAFIYGSTLSSLRQVLFRLFVNQYSAVQYALLLLFLLVLLRILLTRTWLAVLVWCSLLAVPFARSGPILDWAIGMLWSSMMLFALMRVGLLAYAVLLFWIYTTVEVPAPVDLRHWYAFSGWPVFAALLALLVYGFYVSLAGKPIFGRALLDE
jgi:serine/threonine-protein kinase